jgi:DNA ligase-3
LKSTPIWEIEGAEWSESSVHTAGGYSIRFPRVVRIRDDKGWEDHTNLKLMLDLARNKKEFEIKKGAG